MCESWKLSLILEHPYISVQVDVMLLTNAMFCLYGLNIAYPEHNKVTNK